MEHCVIASHLRVTLAAAESSRRTSIQRNARNGRNAIIDTASTLAFRPLRRLRQLRQKLLKGIERWKAA